MQAEPVVDPSLLISEHSPEAQKLKKAALEKISSIRRAFAWQLARWPIEKHMILDNTRIHLPRSYLSKHGEDIKILPPGSDLNLTVHQHYLEEIDPKTNEWDNYVHADKVVARREEHEYLGPDPRVAGYFVDIGGDIRIKWWDSYLADQWMGSQEWQTEVVWNGADWVEKGA